MTEGRPVVRRATTADVPRLVELRALMFAAMGRDVGAADAPWRRAAAEWLTEHLQQPERFAVFVVDVAGSGVVACAIGRCERFGPSPANPTGVRGHVSNLSTLPGHRRRGHARACLAALVEWFRAETAARVLSLHATDEGVAMYRAIGFAEPVYPELQLRLD